MASSSRPKVEDWNRSRRVRHIFEPEHFQLNVNGQGVVCFILNDKSPKALSFDFCPQNDAFPRLTFSIEKDLPSFSWRLSAELCEHLPSKTLFAPDESSVGFSQDQMTCYWISIDSWNRTLRYGKGEARLSCTLLEVVYGEPVTLLNPAPVPDRFGLMKTLKKVIPSSLPQSAKLWTWTNPVVMEPAVAVVTSPQAKTMDEVAAPCYFDLPNDNRRVFTVGRAAIESLSHECQRLYGNISGFALDTAFTQALEFSLRDPNGLGYKILKTKLDSPEFEVSSSATSATSATSADSYTYKEIYLRITLGNAQGDSPGVPYVLEIWPGGCGSPVHNHGGTFAVIKVLAGQIDIDLHRTLSETESKKPVRHLTFQKDDVTFITPGTNQIHRLRNLKENRSTCITIQCYTYPDDDTLHDPYFHFVEKGLPGDFTPITDVDFAEFKASVLASWAAAGYPEMVGDALDDMWWQTYEPPIRSTPSSNQ